ncbi:crooked neck protein, putative [Ixodes scapularis]|uniref:Crooked neck protein, putative n=1 Tax=Ixodes scapularis TaxID=6945 RepID=B7Q836_IXOSC|nr:crooked neck protein, putative [Ixodes scapularis]|eukprot:XP_002412275.1 crooked neck protein, putative [Ixodes scapularis]
MASTSGAKPQKIPKVAKVKNKTPAEIQITAEQLLREAKERDLEILPPPPKQKISDPEELAEYQIRKRKGFEDNIRKNRSVISNWIKYAQWEESQKEIQRGMVESEASGDTLVMVHPDVKHWIKYARFEEQNGYISNARRVYERAVEFFGEEYMDEKLFVAFAKFEENQREHDRVRVIYKYALDHIPKDKAQELFKNYTIHEKKYGDRAGIEDVIVSKRKYQYEEQIKENPLNYDAWFDYLRLMESEGNVDATRETYERAIANVPLSKEKRYWRRYIYLWVNYALFEELETGDAGRTREVYRACLRLLPHKSFTFAKLWLWAAYFEVRQKDLAAARKLLGTAIGLCPKDKLFRGYIDLEIQLREFDRCRILYQKFLEFAPENCTTWMKFAELETILGDVERARAVYEIAIGQPRLDMPEVIWKSYIDFEIEQEEPQRAAHLYERLLERTQHVKVWISFAHFQLNYGGEDPVPLARTVYERANKQLRTSEEKEERLMLLESWSEFEAHHGDEQSQEAVAKQMPKKVKKRRKIVGEDGTEAGWEEYFDYIFPTDEAAKPHLKLLEIAKKWKKQQQTEDDQGEEGQE